MRPLYVVGIGVVAPGLRGWDEAAPVFAGTAAWQDTRAELPIPAILPKNERRRSTPAIRLALEATHQAATMSGLSAHDLPIVFGCSGGDGEIVHALMETVSTPEARVSPTLFHNSVHNAPAGYWCIAAGSRQSALSLGAYDSTVAASLLTAAVQAQRAPVLVCVYDAVYPEPLHTARPLAMPFGAALVLAPEPGAGALGRLDIALGAHGRAVSQPQAPALEPLFAGNPSAQLVPVLEALARRQSRDIVIAWDDSLPLTVGIAPC